MTRKKLPVLGLLFVLLAVACGGGATETSGEAVSEPSGSSVMTVYRSPT